MKCKFTTQHKWHRSIRRVVGDLLVSVNTSEIAGNCWKHENTQPAKLLQMSFDVEDVGRFSRHVPGVYAFMLASTMCYFNPYQASILQRVSIYMIFNKMSKKLNISETFPQQIHQDWSNREYIEIISASIKRITEFLNTFDLSCRSRLATLNEKLSALERRIDYLDACLARGETALT